MYAGIVLLLAVSVSAVTGDAAGRDSGSLQAGLPFARERQASQEGFSEYLSREVIYTAEDSQKEFPFPETIEEDGSVYFLDAVHYETISVRKNPRQSENLRIVMSDCFEDTGENHIPEREITENGKTYYLKSWKTVTAEGAAEKRSGEESEPGEKSVQEKSVQEKSVQAIYSDRPPGEKEKQGRLKGEPFSSDSVGQGDSTYTIKAAARYISNTEPLKRKSAGARVWEWLKRREAVVISAGAGMIIMPVMLILVRKRFRRK